MTTKLHEIVEFAPRAQLYMLERSGSFGHLEEPDAVIEHLRNCWTRLKS
jgi:pimeloyl-ACP methyl ester carboxylesterase